LNYLKRKNLRIGLLGGSFDPPHKGHVTISNISIKKLNLHYLTWVVSKKNPFKKKPVSNVKSRIKLSKKITKNVKKKVKVEYFDKLVNSSKSYDLLKFLKKFNKSSKYFFIIGADNFINFHKWYKWKEIPKFAKIVVFDRENYSKKALNSIASKKLRKRDWEFIFFKKINISSSKIRKI
jgi:nicotinate-nucleotide adenylyltransferase